VDPLKRILLLIGGIMSVSLGVVGIFVPLLPTVPFLLLAAYCFGRSSQRFHTWLLSSKPFGKMISDYKAGRGIPVSVKVVSITFLWLVIAVSVIWSLETTLSKIVVMLVGIAVTIHLMMLRSYR
jgi:hypothetical protein